MKKIIVTLSIALVMLILALYIESADSAAANDDGAIIEPTDTGDGANMELIQEIDALTKSTHNMQFMIIAIITSMTLYSFVLFAILFLFMRKRSAKVKPAVAADSQPAKPVREQGSFAEHLAKNTAIQAADTADIKYIPSDKADTADFIAFEYDAPPQDNPRQDELECIKNDSIATDANENADTDENDLDCEHASVTGNFFAEAIRHVTGADIAFINSGGICEPLYSNEITESDVVRAFPFDDTVTVQGLTESRIKSVLEHSAAALPEKDGRFLYVSGMTFEVDASMPEGERILSMMLADGTYFDNTAEYIVAANDYIANGGDGYDVLASLPKMSDGQTVAQAVLEYAADVGIKDFVLQPQ